MTQQQKKVRLLVVDDSAFVRRAIIRIFENHPAIQVVDVASDGEMALSLVRKLRPDVITLDVKMPLMDGLAALEKIMSEIPTPVVMLSSLTEKGGENTLRALDLGAVDFIDKSTAAGGNDISALADELAMKIIVASKVDVSKIKPSHPRLPAPNTFGGRGKEAELCVVGTSTGGPTALHTLLSRLPSDFPCPILVVQHMPPGFTRSLAARLDNASPLSVAEAVDGERLAPGRVLIAPAGKHLKVHREGKDLFCRLDDDPADALHRPSVDVLLHSAATACGRRCIASVLTGMGRDGTAGAVAVKAAGGKIIVESEESAIVNGMPRSVSDAVDVDAVATIDALPETLLSFLT